MDSQYDISYQIYVRYYIHIIYIYVYDIICKMLGLIHLNTKNYQNCEWITLFLTRAKKNQPSEPTMVYPWSGPPHPSMVSYEKYRLVDWLLYQWESQDPKMEVR